MIGLVIVIVVIIALVIWFVEWCSSFCPSCKKAWAKEETDNVLINSRRAVRYKEPANAYRDNDDEAPKNRLQKAIGFMSKVQIVTVKTYRVDCRCKHCGHEWSYNRTEEK